MHIIKAFWIFYCQILIPSAFASGVVAMLLGSFLTYSYSFGISYVFTSVLFQYVVYELISSHEYYAYYNIGLSKFTLWLLNLVVSASIGLSIANLF